MKSFNETIAPDVHGSVSFAIHLEEAIQAPDHYDYLGPKEHAPSPNQFVSPGVIRHPKFEDDYARVHPDGRVSRIPEDKVDGVIELAKSAFKHKLHATHLELVDHFDKYTSKDADAISKYTSNSSVNRDLLSNPNHKSSLTSALDSAIARHAAPDDITVYSGTSIDHANSLRTHSIVHHPAYLSSSPSINAARSFANKNAGDIMKIVIPKGHPCAYISDHSKHTGEYEVLLPKGLNLKIDKSKEQVFVGKSGSYKVHHCDIVGDKE